MGGEGGQGLVDGLLVADVRQHGGAHPHRGAVRRRDVQPTLGHQGEQAQGFQGDGLAAGVGAGDDQGIERSAQGQVVAHGGLGVQQGVARPFQLNAAAQHRFHGPHGGGQLGPGENAVQGHQSLVVVLNVRQMPGAVGGQLGQDPLDLLLLLGLELPQLVVGVYHPHGLDEEGAAGAGHVVNQAGYVVLVLALHGHHVAAPPHGDDGVLQILGLVGRDEPVEHIPHLARRRPDVPPDVGQLRGGCVGDLVLAEDGASDLVLQKTVGGEAVEIAVQHRFPLAPAAVFPDIPGAAQHLGDVQQLPGVQRAPPVRPLQGGGHGTYARQGRRTVLHQQFKGGGRLLLQAVHVARDAHRPQGQAPLPALLGGRLIRQQGQHPGQLQGLNGFFK